MKRYFAKSEFSRNVVTMMTGTLLAQAMPIAIAPILTRIYTPEDFGIFAIYMACASIASIFATGRYELAVMLADYEDDAICLVVLSITISFIISLLLLFLIFLFNQDILKLLNQPQIGQWLYFIPATVLLTGIYQSLYNLSNRNKQYKKLAISKVLQNGVTCVSQTALTSASNFNGLIIGENLGKLISTSILAKISWRENRSEYKLVNQIKIIKLARKYKKFPIYEASATLANVLSYQLQNIFFPILYGIASAGNYFLIFKVLQAPLSLISSTLIDVYKQKLSSKNTNLSEYRILYKKMFFFCLLTGIVPFTILTVFSTDIFIFVFGDNWTEAGKYASILAPMFYIRYIANPLSYFLLLKDKQEFNILGHITLLASTLLAFYISKTALEAATIISICFSIIYLIYIWYAAVLSGVLIKK